MQRDVPLHAPYYSGHPFFKNVSPPLPVVRAGEDDRTAALLLCALFALDMLEVERSNVN